jgi:hypothetical protein
MSMPHISTLPDRHAHPRQARNTARSAAGRALPFVARGIEEGRNGSPQSHVNPGWPRACQKMTCPSQVRLSGQVEPDAVADDRRVCPGRTRLSRAVAPDADRHFPHASCRNGLSFSLPAR